MYAVLAAPPALITRFRRLQGVLFESFSANVWRLCALSCSVLAVQENGVFAFVLASQATSTHRAIEIGIFCDAAVTPMSGRS